MKNWEYVLLNSLDDLRWCEGLYAYYDDGIKRCMTTTMTSLIFQIFNGC